MKRYLHCILLLLMATIVGAGCSKSSKSPTDPGGGGGPDNHSPTAYLTVDSLRIAVGHSSQFTVNSTDPDGDQLTFTYASIGGTVSVGGNTAINGTFSATQRGNASVTVTASDGNGGTAQATAALYVYSLVPPTITQTVEGYGDGGCPTFSVTVAETLTVSVETLHYSHTAGRTSQVGNGFGGPRTMYPGQTITFYADNSNCASYSGDAWFLIIYSSRPRDGVVFKSTKMYDWY